MVKEDLVHVEKVIKAKRLNNRMEKIAMEYGRKILHVFSVYATQQGRPEEEKRKLSDNIHDIPQEDQHVMVLRM